MTLASLTHHQSFQSDLERSIDMTLAKAEQCLSIVRGHVERGEDLDPEVKRWLCDLHVSKRDNLLGELHGEEAKLLSWIDQNFSLDTHGQDLAIHDLINRSNRCRSQMSFGALLEATRFQLEEVLFDLNEEMARGVADVSNIAKAEKLINDWKGFKDKLLSGELLFPEIKPEDQTFVVPNSAAAGFSSLSGDVSERPPQAFNISTPDALLERIIVGAPGEFAWAEDLISPRADGIRKQLLLRPAREGKVLRVMQHLGDIDGGRIKEEIVPDLKTLDDVVSLSKEARDRLVAKGSWVSDITTDKLNRYFNLPGSVFLTLESLNQAVNFDEFGALGSEESSSARFFLLEQCDRGSSFKVEGNLIIFQQPELLDEWQHIPTDLREGHRCAWCSSLRVSIDPSIQVDPHQGSKMLDTAMINLTHNSGFTRLIAKVLDGPEELANKGAMRLHKQNGWHATDSTYREVIKLDDHSEQTISWRFVYRDLY